MPFVKKKGLKKLKQNNKKLRKALLDLCSNVPESRYATEVRKICVQVLKETEN